MNARRSASPVRVAFPGGAIEGSLTLPAAPAGVVLFAHGSGSSRHSPRNLFVAGRLQDVGLATLLVDLLTAAEDADYEARFDIALLAARLRTAAQYLSGDARTAALPLGLFGASTGAAAAVEVAAALPERVTAVVARGGRPDLASREALRTLRAPTLFIVGGRDHGVIELNRRAMAGLHCPHRLSIVAGATHLFEEPGTLEEVAELAATWFARYLIGAAQTA